MPAFHTHVVKITDTLAQAKELHPGKRNSLDALCERYGISNAHRTLHGALLDSELLAEVYLAMTRGQDSLSMDLHGSGSGIDGGDDAIAIKSGINFLGREFARPTRDVLITRLVVESGNGIAVGSFILTSSMIQSRSPHRRRRHQILCRPLLSTC